ncbi:hypothetical protein O5O45_26435 [Hahella aquimaris]|uniref:hypothetical protein n=1 Tax=Hahella sp. HNIBRBA332 TaxID=3015983 RepID=UPI00273BB5D0|nr:hypothetical protein [Hahella sp. HNIBRBA332]WLQ13269.1 hypothetical protein O5O45_26435 [Hahella sp. HNIBRBA332]
MKNINAIPAPHRPSRGFHGAMCGDAAAAWPLAVTAIANATGQPVESVRRFLESGYGRHFADDVIERRLNDRPLEEAINSVTARWMEWSIGPLTSMQYGIAANQPFLTGFVIYCERIAEEI